MNRSFNVDLVPLGYATLLADVKQRVQHAQVRAMLAVNAELIRLYWEIGQVIDLRQQQEGWGSAVIPRLARDLHNELPEEKGFSERNIKRMLAFYREYAHLEFVPQPVAQIQTSAKVQPPVALFPAELVTQAVCQSIDARQQASRLLDAARRAVEIAIEDSEASALAFLERAR